MSSIYFRRHRQEFATLTVDVTSGECTSGVFVCHIDMRDSVGMEHKVELSGMFAQTYMSENLGKL